MGTANSSQAQILLTTTTHFTFIYVGEIRQLTIFRFYTFVAFCLPLGHVWTILTLPLASSPNLLFFVIQTTTLLSHITSNTSPNHKQECITSTMWQINYDTYKVQGLMPHELNVPILRPVWTRKGHSVWKLCQITIQTITMLTPVDKDVALSWN